MATAAFIVLCVAVLVVAISIGNRTGYIALVLALIALLLAVVPGFLR